MFQGEDTRLSGDFLLNILKLSTNLRSQPTWMRGRYTWARWLGIVSNGSFTVIDIHWIVISSINHGGFLEIGLVSNIFTVSTNDANSIILNPNHQTTNDYLTKQSPWSDGLGVGTPMPKLDFEQNVFLVFSDYERT